jgi:hypothetical protein
VYETNGNIFQVAMEMGHKDTKTTHHYLNFQRDEIKQYFPSLIPIIESMENISKSARWEQKDGRIRKTKHFSNLLKSQAS